MLFNSYTFYFMVRSDFNIRFNFSLIFFTMFSLFFIVSISRWSKSIYKYLSLTSGRKGVVSFSLIDLMSWVYQLLCSFLDRTIFFFSRLVMALILSTCVAFCNPQKQLFSVHPWFFRYHFVSFYFIYYAS